MISIITPVHNSAKRIGNYLDSVLAQTCSDLEVILVDDHGGDNSIELAHAVTDSYSGPVKFKYAATPRNSGPGAARNVGLDIAAGEYVAFVDSDDIIDPRFCELLLSSAEKNSSDLCCCHLEIVEPDGKTSARRYNPSVPDGCFAGKDRERFLTSYVSYFCTFLYRRAFLESNKIRFPEGYSSEDSAMLCCSLFHCRRISQVNACLYKYLRQETSLSARVNPLRYRQRLASMASLMDTLKSRGLYEADREVIDFIYFKKGFLMAVFDYMNNNRPISSEALASICEELDDKAPEHRRNRYLRQFPKYRILEFSIRHCPRLTGLAIRAFLSRGGNSVI